MCIFEITRKTFVNPDEIIWVQSSINYSDIHLRDGSYITVALTLKHVELKLNSFGSFIRINRSYAVNKKFIKKFAFMDKQMIVEMQNNKRFMVARRRQKQLCID